MRLGRGSGISLRRGRGVFFHRLPLSLRPAGQERLVVVASACRHGQSSSRAMAPGGALRGRSTGGRRLNDSSSTFFAFLRFRFTKTSSTRSEEHTSELQSLMRISYAVFCLKKKKQ